MSDEYYAILDRARPALGDDGYTAKDIATLAHERALMKRLDTARQLYQREIRAHAHPGTRPYLELNAQTIIETLAGCLPLEDGEGI